jgi:hypothetical protein
MNRRANKTRALTAVAAMAAAVLGACAMSSEGGPTVDCADPAGLGTPFNRIWSTSGATNRKDVNSTYLQPFANYNLGSRLAVGVSMEASGNWDADEHWTAPLLFQVSKVTLLGKRPVNLAVAAGPTVASPAGGPNWRFRLVATFLYPR